MKRLILLAEDTDCGGYGIRCATTTSGRVNNLQRTMTRLCP